MKNMPILFILALMSLISMGCQESSKKSSSSSSQSAYCLQNPYAQGCYGTTPPGSTGGTTTQACFQSTSNYWSMPGCPGFCQNYPSHPNCAGTTTGGTPGGTPGGSTGTGTNPYPNYSSNPIYQNWGVQYPGGEPPVINCEPAVAPAGVTYTPYETRKATMTIQGGTYYNPASGVPYANTSTILKTVTSAKTLLETDSVLKMRIKVKPQPPNSSGAHYCYIPNYSAMSSQAGHYKLRFSVSVVGTKANGTVEEDFVGNFEKKVNECTPVINLSSYASTYPGGMYFKVYDVQDNTQTWPDNYAQWGFRDGTGWRTVRSMDCWTLDVEVAADGTKVFPE